MIHDNDYDDHLIALFRTTSHCPISFSRVVNALEIQMKESKVDYNYEIPREICVMLNVLSNARTQVGLLCYSL